MSKKTANSWSEVPKKVIAMTKEDKQDRANHRARLLWPPKSLALL